MSISTKGLPAKISPAFNPVVFYADSTNKNELGFKYVVDVFSAGTSTRFLRETVTKRPVDGYLEIDVWKTLASQISFHINPDLTGSTNTQFYNVVNYDVYVGEQFTVYWDYFDYYFYNNTGSSYNAYVQLSSTTEDHNFIIGDLVNVIQANTSGQTNVSGVQEVVEIPNARSIVIGIPFTTSGPVVGGTVTFADLGKTTFSGLSSYTNYTVFNGALSHKDYKDYDYTDVLLGTAHTGSFLTDMPNDYRTRTDSTGYFNYVFTGNSNQFLTIKTSDGQTGRINIGAFTAGTVGVFPKQLNNSTLLQGTQPLISSATTRYSAYTEQQSTSGISSSVKTFTVECDCTKYGVYELLFMDRKGSWISVPCEYKNTRSINVSKAEFEGFLGGLIGSKYSYTSLERGRQNINIVEEEIMTLNTAWLSLLDRRYLRQLYTSPEVYLKEPGETEFWPVIVTTSALAIPELYNKRQVSYSVDIVKAYRNPIQSF